MYCKYCGNQLPDGAKECPNCASRVQYAFDAGADNSQNNDKSSFLLALVGFFFPLVGLILYLCIRKDEPKKAKSAGKGALAGVIIYIVFVVIITALSTFTALYGTGRTDSDNNNYYYNEYDDGYNYYYDDDDDDMYYNYNYDYDNDSPEYYS